VRCNAFFCTVMAISLPGNRRFYCERVRDLAKGQRETVVCHLFPCSDSIGLRFVDWLAGAQDELLTDKSIRAARTRTRQIAIALTDTPDEARRPEMMANLDETASAAGRLIALLAARSTLFSAFLALGPQTWRPLYSDLAAKTKPWLRPLLQ
jgi:hypothetical protein